MISRGVISTHYYTKAGEKERKREKEGEREKERDKEGEWRVNMNNQR